MLPCWGKAIIDFNVYNYADVSNLESPPYILLTNTHFIHQLSLDGTRERTIVSDSIREIYAVDYHYR